MVIQHSRPTGSRVVSTLRLCVWLGVFFATSLRLLLLARANDDASNQDFFQQVHSATQQRGVIFTAEYTGEGFANHSGGIQSGATYEGLVAAEVVRRRRLQNVAERFWRALQLVGPMS